MAFGAHGVQWPGAYGGPVRVIAGSSRGRLLRAPAGGKTRPTADRVREAIFDMLGSLMDLDGASVADLFAGSGAMGIEALSRGAGSVVFVDSAPSALKAVSSNLVSAGLAEAPATIVRADVLAWLSRQGQWHSHKQGRRESQAVAAGRGVKRFDLVLCDPPYDFRAWEDLLGRLEAAVAVLESNRPIEVPEGWNAVRHKRYGGTLVTVVIAAAPRSFGGSEGDDGIGGGAAEQRTTSDEHQGGTP